MPKQTPADDERAEAILRRKAAGSLGLDDALAELADADCDAILAQLIAERIGIAAHFIARALDAPSDEDLSVICRAAGLNMNSYSALLRMRRRRDRTSEGAPADALKLFAELSPAAAKQMLSRLVPGFSQRRPPIRRAR